MKIIILFTVITFFSSKLFSQISDSSNCIFIEKTYDEFDKETTYSTSALEELVFIKVIKGGRGIYYLSLYSYGYTASVSIKGVKIILSNKQTVSFPNEEVDVNVSSGKYRYSVFITLTQDKIELFRKHSILKWKLYIYENEISEEKADGLKDKLNCLISMK